MLLTGLTSAVSGHSRVAVVACALDLLTFSRTPGACGSPIRRSTGRDRAMHSQIGGSLGALKFDHNTRLFCRDDKFHSLGLSEPTILGDDLKVPFLVLQRSPCLAPMDR